MRLPALLTPVLLIVGWSGSATAYNLTTDAQIGITRAHPSQLYWTVWARRSDGNLVSRREQLPNGTVWADHGKVGGYAVSSKGVSATGWIDGSTYHERVYYVDTSGFLVERAFQNSIQISSKRFAPPSGKTLTGHVAASWSWTGQTRNLRAYVTTLQHDLYALGLPEEEWDHLEAFGISSNQPLAASASPDHAHTRVFASTTNGNVSMWRWDGLEWIMDQLGNPGVSV